MRPLYKTAKCFPPMNLRWKRQSRKKYIEIQNCCTYNYKFSLTIHDNMKHCIVFLADLLYWKYSWRIEPNFFVFNRWKKKKQFLEKEIILKTKIFVYSKHRIKTMKIKSHMINFSRFLFSHKYHAIAIICPDNVCCICDKNLNVLMEK